MNSLLFRIEEADPVNQAAATAQLYLCGNWQLGDAPEGASLCTAIPANCKTIVLDTTELTQWDSSLASALLQLARWCEQQQITLDTSAAPDALQQLLTLATSIPVYQTSTNEVRQGF